MMRNFSKRGLVIILIFFIINVIDIIVTDIRMIESMIESMEDAVAPIPTLAEVNVSDT